MISRRFLFVAMYCLALSTSELAAKIQTLFAPQDNPTATLISLIDGAKKSIHAAVYMITDQKVASALATAALRGVTVNIIVDPASLSPQFNKMDLLFQSGANVHVYQPKVGGYFPPLMHNKFAIFDASKLWTGSFNWTVTAGQKNAENVIISDDSAVCAAYLANFLNIATTKCAPYNSKTSKQHGTPLKQQIQKLLDSPMTDEALFEALTLVLNGTQPA